MQQIVADVHVRIVGDSEAKELAIRSEPLLRFNDPVREFDDGAVWAFGENGRPAMLLAIERYEAKKLWSYELISLTAAGLRVDWGDGWTWSPKESAIELQPFESAPAPAKSERARLLQIKQLVRRFDATETVNGEPYDLRLLPKPIARYSDANAGIVDGAMFILAFGTNPEVIAFVECHQRNDQQQWRHGFAPLTSAAAEVKLNGKRVWSKAFDRKPRTEQPYTYFSIKDED